MSTATTDKPLSLPALSIKLTLSLDLLRKRIRQIPALAALTRQVGPLRFVEPRDLPRVKQLLAADLPA
jgi:hypothetical protein